MELAKDRRFAFTDESYIHHNYKCHGDSLYDPVDDRPVSKEEHKGRRYCFIAAILSKDPHAPTSDELGALPAAPPATAADHLGPLPAPPTPSHAAQLMRETVDIFTGGTSKKKETADYHGMFDHKYYKGWMQKLLA